ncbi:olfactory binding protein S homeolog precursor [Xenopus laevis]|uniref:Olfactory binding protein n=1 Tax=Xenopus laevis TaxID=8355 RepID=B8PWQ8_XENLA|nr:olfactory binding protein S homeolog precursor [Xenopus laevis]ABZ10842.1 olfactory binding protein [Xenopus laevis]
MLPTVRLVLLSLVFISQMHAADIPVDPDFTVDKLLGEWTGVAAASNSPMLMKKKEQMKTEPVTKYWMDGANLISSTAFRTSKGCKTRKVILKEAEKGRYTYTGKGESRMSIIRITPTLCLEHTITTMPNGNIYFNLKLYKKGAEPPKEMEKFTEYALSLGLKKENVVFFEKGEKCPSN